MPSCKRLDDDGKNDSTKVQYVYRGVGRVTQRYKMKRSVVKTE